jgi:hypothetical protein
MYFLNGYGTLTTAFDCAENLCSRLRSECLPARPSEHDKKGADCEKGRGKEPRRLPGQRLIRFLSAY